MPAWLAPALGLRVATWNPFTLKQPFRLEGISRVFKNVHILGLQGTKLRAQAGLQHTEQQVPYHRAFHFGH